MSNKLIYIATSWKNKYYEFLRLYLIKNNFNVYNFRNPFFSFYWSNIDKNYLNWNFDDFKLGLNHPLANKGFNSDYNNLFNADICILLLPCGLSAHLEFGFFKGLNKIGYIFVPKKEKISIELMYKFSDNIFNNINDLMNKLNKDDNNE